MPRLRVCTPRGGHIFPNVWRLEGVSALALLVLTACAGGKIVDGVFVDEARGFKVPVLSDGWRRFEAEGVEIAFRADPGGQVAALVVECEGQQAVPLQILSRRLFFGIGAKRVIAQEQVSLNGTEAIHTLLEGRVKDAEVMVSSYVAKDATCVYDLIYAADPAVFEERLPEFERFVNGWILTGKQGH
ncbi:MAG: hypothetical protein HYY12_03380 [Candidatus Methylomirabilis oxyfera]|nr:hypothetical protein [Candidatus Methylomirabilis oxyfera]